MRHFQTYTGAYMRSPSDSAKPTFAVDIQMPKPGERRTKPALDWLLQIGVGLSND